MPSTSQTTPEQRINPAHTDVLRTGLTPRRASSPKQASTITSSQWPVVSHAAYTQLTRQGEVPAELANLRLRRLAACRNQLGLCITGLANCMHDHRESQPLDEQQKADYAKVWQRLRAAHKQVEKLYLEFPLEVR